MGKQVWRVGKVKCNNHISAFTRFLLVPLRTLTVYKSKFGVKMSFSIIYLISSTIYPEIPCAQGKHETMQFLIFHTRWETLNLDLSATVLAKTMVEILSYEIPRSYSFWPVDMVPEGMQWFGKGLQTVLLQISWFIIETEAWSAFKGINVSASFDLWLKDQITNWKYRIHHLISSSHLIVAQLLKLLLFHFTGLREPKQNMLTTENFFGNS